MSRLYFIKMYSKPTFDYLGSFTHYAYILHDKDVDKNGNLKKPHYHLLVYRKDETTTKRMIEEIGMYFGDDVAKGCNVQAVKSKVAVFRYLTHKDDPDKHQYNDSEVVVDKRQFFDGQQSDPFIDIFEEFVNNGVTGEKVYELARQHGRDFICNWKKIAECAQYVRNRRAMKSKWHAYSYITPRTDLLGCQIARNVTCARDRKLHLARLRTMLKCDHKKK